MIKTNLYNYFKNRKFRFVIIIILITSTHWCASTKTAFCYNTQWNHDNYQFLNNIDNQNLSAHSYNYSAGFAVPWLGLGLLSLINNGFFNKHFLSIFVKFNALAIGLITAVSAIYFNKELTQKLSNIYSLNIENHSYSDDQSDKHHLEDFKYEQSKNFKNPKNRQLLIPLGDFEDYKTFSSHTYSQSSDNKTSEFFNDGEINHYISQLKYFDDLIKETQKLKLLTINIRLFHLGVISTIKYYEIIYLLNYITKNLQLHNIKNNLKAYRKQVQIGSYLIETYSVPNLGFEEFIDQHLTNYYLSSDLFDKNYNQINQVFLITHRYHSELIDFIKNNQINIPIDELFNYSYTSYNPYIDNKYNNLLSIDQEKILDDYQYIHELYSPHKSIITEQNLQNVKHLITASSNDINEAKSTFNEALLDFNKSKLITTIELTQLFIHQAKIVLFHVDDSMRYYSDTEKTLETSTTIDQYALFKFHLIDLITPVEQAFNDFNHSLNFQHLDHIEFTQNLEKIHNIMLETLKKKNQMLKIADDWD